MSCWGDIMPMGDRTARTLPRMQRTTLRFRGCHGLTAASLQVPLLSFSSLELLPHETRSKKPEKGFKSKLPRPKPDLDFQGKTGT